MDKKAIKEGLLSKKIDILNILEGMPREKILVILSSILKDYDLTTASNMVKADCEPSLTVDALLEGHMFEEGNEDAGMISVAGLLYPLKEILNASSDNQKVNFTYFMRQETSKEVKDSGKDNSVAWFTEDKKVSLQHPIGFELKSKEVK